MSRIPRALARSIDRLARHAHAFHRFAHHPLCENYAGELISLGGRRRVCRGCLAALLGIVAGVGVALAVTPSARNELVLGALGAALALSSLALRLPKFVARFLPAALGSAALAAATRRMTSGDFDAAIVVGTGLLLLGGAVFAYRRRGPNRSACQSCPERLGAAPCSGLLPIVRRERAFQRLSQRWIDAEARKQTPPNTLKWATNLRGGQPG